MTSRQPVSPLRQARRSFWFLLAVSVLSAGSLSSALAAAPSPRTGLRVVASGLILITSVLLAARVLLAIDRAVRHNRDPLKGHSR